MASTLRMRTFISPGQWKKTPVAWLYWKHEIQSEPAEKLELILAISINYWT